MMILDSRIAFDFDGRTTRVAQACRKHTKLRLSNRSRPFSCR